MITLVRGRWMAFTGPFEGDKIATLYDDIRDLPTVADGVLVSSVAAAQAMRWLRADGTPASSAEIAGEWHRVKDLPGGWVWWRYRSPSGLHLDDAEIERVTLVRFDADVDQLTKTFPDFDTWPWQAQAAALSMAWAMGPGFPATWPLWTAAAKVANWQGCAADCEIRWIDNPGVRPRDFAQQALFLLAAGMSLDEAQAKWPAGSSAEVAGKAVNALLAA